MGRFLISSASGSEICPAPLSTSPQLTAHLYLGKELKQENEEAVVEATAARWSQPDLLERGKRNTVKREEVAPQTRLPAPWPGRLGQVLALGDLALYYSSIMFLKSDTLVGEAFGSKTNSSLGRCLLNKKLATQLNVPSVPPRGRRHFKGRLCQALGSLSGAAK